MKAAECYEKLIEVYPLLTKYRENLAACYMMMNRVPDGIKQYEECLAIDPTDYNAKLSLANVFMHQRNYVKAKKTVKEVIEKDPENASAYHKLGLIYELMEVNHSALNALEVRPFWLIVRLESYFS